MQELAFPTADARATSADAVRIAFRELHGARAHGFALLVTLGDRALAARVAANALGAAARRVDELRHPERAAAWLRARIVESIPRRSSPPGAHERLAGLEPLDVDPAVVTALAALNLRERAALVASGIERLDRRDVATIVGRDGATLDRLLRRARSRYVAAFATASPPGAGADGPLVRRVRTLAARTLQ
jgi:DNA-directed RNA polymerase specialized sigma24 family protein